MAAPTGVNRQPWEFIVIDSPKLLSAPGFSSSVRQNGSQSSACHCDMRQFRSLPQWRRFIAMGPGPAIASENIAFWQHTFRGWEVYTPAFILTPTGEMPRDAYSLYPKNSCLSTLIPIGYPARVRLLPRPNGIPNIFTSITSLKTAAMPVRAIDIVKDISTIVRCHRIVGISQIRPEVIVS